MTVAALSQVNIAKGGLDLRAVFFAVHSCYLRNVFAQSLRPNDPV